MRPKTKVHFRFPGPNRCGIYMSVDVVEVHIGGGHYTWTCPKSCIFIGGKTMVFIQWVPKTQRFAISNSVPEYEKWISVHTSGGTLNTRIGAQYRCVSLQIGPRCVLLLASKARSIKMQRALLRVCLPGCAARHRLRA